MRLSCRIRTDRGQSSPLGFALIVGIVILASVTIVVFGSSALTQTEHSAEIGQAEHTMAQFDSLAAQVALGDATVQSLEIGGANGGGYSADPDAGRIVITHVNFTGDGTDHEIYNETMGAVVYRNGDDEIAYQGGGVWKKGTTGESRMVSPPEFHYRGATLTFPIIRVNPSGDGGGASGAQTLTVRRTNEVAEVFPNPNDGYPDTDDDDDGFANASAPYNNSNDGDGDGGPYENPQKNGTVRVTVQSEYYEAWAEYFRDRTTGNVTVDDATNTVNVDLVSLGIGQGSFQMPREGNPIEVRGLKPQGHALDEFDIELRPNDNDSSDFSNLQWSLHADQGSKEMEIHFNQGSGSVCGTQTVDVTIYYSDDNGNTYHGWKGEDALTVECDVNGFAVLRVDMAQNTSDLTYQELSSDDLLVVNPGGSSDLADPLTIDEHSSVSWESSTYNATDTEEFGHLFSHYMALLGPNIDLEVNDKNGNGGSISEDASSGGIAYEGSGQFVTFLHVSENEVEVEFD